MLESQVSAWSDVCDVAILGGGGGGMAAAISAKQTRPKDDILLIQKLDHLGGSTTMSMGSFTAADTRMQAEAGITDSTDSYFHDLDKFVDLFSKGSGRYFYLDFSGDLHEKENRQLRRVLTEEGGKTHDWLRDQGCEYAGPYHEGHHSVPRTYQIQPDAEAYADVLGDTLADLGVRLSFNTEAYELISDQSNSVVGVVARKEDEEESIRIKAKKGVVLATGDYVNNTALREEFTNDSKSPPINPGSEGDGHGMAEEIGANLVNMDVQWLGFRFSSPLYTSPEFASIVDEGAILVNENGERFVNESMDYDQIYRETLRQPNKCLYLVFDDRTARKFTEWPNHISTLGKDGKVWGYLDEYRDYEVLQEAENIASLADKTEMDSAVMEQTISAYNNGITDASLEQSIDEYGRTDVGSITEPPFYSLGPAFTYSIITDGGVAVDTKLRVLGEDQSPIGGLYAAGVMAGNVHLFGHGQHHNWVFTSGRLAGANIVNQEPI